MTIGFGRHHHNAPGKQVGAASVEGVQAAPTSADGEREKAWIEEVVSGGPEGMENVYEKKVIESRRVEEKGVVVEGVSMVPAEPEECVSPESLVHTVSSNTIVIDMYEVGHKTITRSMCENAETDIPFAHQLKLHGPQGEIVRTTALFDGAAMVAAMCVTLFDKVKHRLGSWQPSKRLLRMANGTIAILGTLGRNDAVGGRVRDWIF